MASTASQLHSTSIDICRVVRELKPVVSTYNDSKHWPALYARAEELDEAYIKIGWDVGKTFILGRYLDRDEGFDAWLMPLTDKYWLIGEELHASYRALELDHIFCVEDTRLLDYLTTLKGWHKELYDNNIYIKTAGLKTFESKKLQRKRQGIRRYNKEPYKLVEQIDRVKAIDLVREWLRQGDAEQGKLVHSEECLRYLDPSYLAKINELTRAELIVLEHEGVYVGAGLGVELNTTKWAMPMRISLRKYQYANDWLWNAMAQKFEQTWCVDGSSFISAGTDLFAYKQSYVNACGGFTCETFKLISPQGKRAS